jgi:hypothetical protein
MADNPNYDDAVRRLAELGAEELAGLIVRALTPAGALAEWDSETIERVLSEFQPVLEERQIPWVGETGADGDAHLYWAVIADELGYESDYDEEDYS